MRPLRRLRVAFARSRSTSTCSFVASRGSLPAGRLVQGVRKPRSDQGPSPYPSSLSGHARQRCCYADRVSGGDESSITPLVVPGRDVVGIRARNPGIFSLSGTNSWLIGRDAAWLIDPGLDLADHRKALIAEIGLRGGLAGIALTHDHIDHAEGLAAMRERFPAARILAALVHDGQPPRRRGTGRTILAVATPGHDPHHFAFLCGDVLFSGDAILGEGSVFIAPDPGALTSYLAALERLLGFAPAVICPGHGPVVLDAEAKLNEYLDHRRDRERRLIDALADGRRSVKDLLDSAWADVPAPLRPAAAVTLAAHLDKLEDEGHLAEGVESPRRPEWLSLAH